MSAHEQFVEDLALHALGVLDGEERTVLEQHLAGCTSCLRELSRLQEAAGWLALSAVGPMPPGRARKRLLQSVAREPRPSRTHAKRPLWSLVIPYGLAGATALLAIFFWSETLGLRQRVAGLERRYLEQQNQLIQARDLVNTFTSQEAKHITLVAVKALPQPQGKAFYVRGTGHLIFLASNMAHLPASKAYELWLIPKTGLPIPAGVFKPDASGNATIVNPPLPTGLEAKAFAITIEPEAGSAAPTTQLIMVGAGE